MVGFRGPVGNISLQVGKHSGKVVGPLDERVWKLDEMRGVASSGPLVEVPWRSISVFVCMLGDSGNIVYGSGYLDGCMVNAVETCVILKGLETKLCLRVCKCSFSDIGKPCTNNEMSNKSFTVKLRK